jgi:MoaA/NifB/PqqE/SkfB family radical SAM enzyme
MSLTKYPKKIQIETFLGCNARCTYCTIGKWKREHGQMSPEIFSRILEQLVPIRNDVEVISLYMDGEPLMDRDLENRIQMCKERGLPHIGFATNGGLLSEDRARKLLDAGLDWVSFSFDSLNKESFEKVRVRLKFNEVLKNIRGLVELRNAGSYGTKVILRHVNSVDKPEELEEYRNYWSELLRPTDAIQSFNVHNWGDGGPISAGEARTPCKYVFDNMTILRDGTVPLCCVDYNALHPFGNVMTTPLMDIWNGMQWEDARQAHLSGQRARIGMCGTCNVPEEVGGVERFDSVVDLQPPEAARHLVAAG